MAIRNLATKQDVDEQAARANGRFQEISQEIASLRDELGGLKKELAAVRKLVSASEEKEKPVKKAAKDKEE